MAEFETEEQQIEQLRKWWQENGRAVVLGVVLGLGAVGGWRGWVYYSETRAETASGLYHELMGELDTDADAVARLAAELIADYTDTPYAELAALADARAAVSQDDLERARERLAWARDNARQDNIRDIAALRLARVLHQADDLDRAMEILDRSFPAAFLGAVEELRGDIHAARGEREEARESYRRALTAPLSGGNRDVLEMKFNELREADGEAS